MRINLNAALSNPLEFSKKAAFFCFLSLLFGITFSNSFFEIFSFGLIFFSGFYLFKSKQIYSLSKYLDTLFLLALVFLIINILSISGSSYFDASLRGALKVLKNVLLLACSFWVIEDRQKLHKTLHVIAWVCILLCVDAIIQGFIGYDLIRGRAMTPYWERVWRVTGPFEHANDFASYLTFGGVLLIAKIRDTANKKWETLAYSLATVMHLVCLIWTYSRGAWLACAFCVFAYLLIKKDLKFIALMIVFIIVSYFAAPASVKDRMHSFLNKRDGTVTERSVLWDETLSMVEKRPWLGFGVNTYSRVNPDFKSKSFKTDKQYAHNGYLQMASEIGLVGLVSFLLFLLYFLFQTFVSFLRSKDSLVNNLCFAVFLGSVAFLIHCLADTGLHSLRLVNLLWISIGICWAARRIART